VANVAAFEFQLNAASVFLEIALVSWESRMKQETRESSNVTKLFSRKARYILSNCSISDDEPDEGKSTIAAELV